LLALATVRWLQLDYEWDFLGAAIVFWLATECRFLICPDTLAVRFAEAISEWAIFSTACFMLRMPVLVLGATIDTFYFTYGNPLPFTVGARTLFRTFPKVRNGARFSSATGFAHFVESVLSILAVMAHTKFPVAFAITLAVDLLTITGPQHNLHFFVRMHHCAQCAAIF